MGAFRLFLIALERLVKTGGIKKIEQAIKFAENQFGKISKDGLFRKQIENVFKKAKKPTAGTPAKKEATVTPIREGIETLADAKVADENSALMDRLTKRIEDAKKPVDLDSTENVRAAIKNLEDQTRLGGDESNIRAALREFLERRLKDGTLNIPDGAERDAIEKVYQGGVDPIDVFRKAYGEDAIIAVSDVFEQFGDEIVRGSNNYKELGDNFEKYFRRNRGFYDMADIPVPKEKYGYDEGLMSNKEFSDKLKKDLKEKEMLEDFDPTDRTKNAEGGLMRTSYAFGTGLKLATLLARKGKNLKEEIKKAIDNIFPSGDSKYDADVALDNMLEDLNIDRDAVDGYDVSKAYGEAYDMLTAQRGLRSTKVPGGMTPGSSDMDRLKELGAPKLAERFELKQKYPGITDDLLNKILIDDNPQRKAEVLASIDEAFRMMEKGKGTDEIVDILEKAKKTRKDNATGGRVRAASGGLAKILNL